MQRQVDEGAQSQRAVAGGNAEELAALLLQMTERLEAAEREKETLLSRHEEALFTEHERTADAEARMQVMLARRIPQSGVD